MIGYLTWRGTGWRIRYYEEEIGGVKMLRAELPGPARPGRGLRLARRAVETLRCNGVTRFLNPGPGVPRTVATGPLWRALAAPLAVTGLTALGVPTAEARVALRAGRVDRTVAACCAALAGEVRALSLEIPDCDGLTWSLQRRFGIPVLTGGGDLTLCFSGQGDGVDLRGDAPAPEGFALRSPALELPGGCPAEPLLAYFVEQGVLHLTDISVVATEKQKVFVEIGGEVCYNEMS